jgi:hypothetical protein
MRPTAAFSPDIPDSDRPALTEALVAEYRRLHKEQHELDARIDQDRMASRVGEFPRLAAGVNGRTRGARTVFAFPVGMVSNPDLHGNVPDC